MAKNGKKKHLKHCNYDCVSKFGIEGVGINTIILFFSDKKLGKHHMFVIEGSAMVHYLRNVFIVRVDHLLE